MADFKKDFEYTTSEIQLLVDKAKPLLDLCKNKEPDYYYCSAIGSMLHSFYNGIEKNFILVNKNIDKCELFGDRTHKELLELATKKTEKRNPLISEDTKNLLKDYMTFRHFFRHSYDFQLKWELLKPLFFNMESTWNVVKTDFDKFAKSYFV